MCSHYHMIMAGSLTVMASECQMLLPSDVGWTDTQAGRRSIPPTAVVGQSLCFQPEAGDHGEQSLATLTSHDLNTALP